MKRLARLGMVENAPGMSALDMNSAEDMVVRNTREVVPGMIICGMEVNPHPLCLLLFLSCQLSSTRCYPCCSVSLLAADFNTLSAAVHKYTALHLCHSYI